MAGYDPQAVLLIEPLASLREGLCDEGYLIARILQSDQADTSIALIVGFAQER
jgi:hypothetical protein